MWISFDNILSNFKGIIAGRLEALGRILQWGEVLLKHCVSIVDEHGEGAREDSDATVLSCPTILLSC